MAQVGIFAYSSDLSVKATDIIQYKSFPRANEKPPAISYAQGLLYLLFNYHLRLETKGVGQEHILWIRVTDDRDSAVRVGDHGYWIRIAEGVPRV